MTERWVRRYRRQLQGSLNCWLVSRETMKDALRKLLSDSERYTILIKLPRTNWETGKSQDTELTLYESDAIELDAAIDPRLLRSRRVNLIISGKKAGTAEINLSKRTWRIIQDSAPIRDALIDFNAKLISAKRGRFVSYGWGVSALLAPIWSIMLAFFAWSVSDTKARHYFFGSGKKVNPNDLPPPHWFVDFALVMVISWPVWACVFIGIVIISSLSGGLLVWPESLTVNSLAEATYRLRTNLFTTVNVNTLIISTVVALLSVIFTFLFTH